MSAYLQLEESAHSSRAAPSASARPWLRRFARKADTQISS
jgi:hypothetical protein